MVRTGTISAGVWPRNSVVAIEGNTRIAGAGIGQTIIDGVNAYDGLICGDSNDTVFDLEVSDLSITGFGGAFGDSGIRADDCNTTISRVEISDWTSLTNNGAAIRIRAESANDISADLTDIYIHDGVGYALDFLPDGGTIAGNVNRLTVTGMTGPPNDVGVGVKASIDTETGLHSQINLSNITIANNENYVGVLVTAFKSGVFDVNLSNSVIINNLITDPMFAGYPGGIASTAVTIAPGFISSTNIVIQGVVLANNSTSNCMVHSDNSSGGTVSAQIITQGGNIADDSSCGFIHASDQQDVDDILELLTPLQNNGGIVPSITLLSETEPNEPEDSQRPEEGNNSNNSGQTLVDTGSNSDMIRLAAVIVCILSLVIYKNNGAKVYSIKK